MAMTETINAIFEDDFINLYNFGIKVGYIIIKITKRSPEIAILVKNNEMCDFGGSFGNFLEPFGNLSTLFSF
jgi:hypothetical protein